MIQPFLKVVSISNMASSRRQRTIEVIETPGSSMLARFSYDVKEQVLAVEFKHGRRYEYYDVPEAVFKQMVEARSKGRFFQDNIRDDYEFSRD